MIDLPLDWDVEVGDVAETKIDESLEVVLAKMVFEALPSKFFAIFLCK